MVTTQPAMREITFQGKDPGELFQFYFRQHWIRMMAPLFRMGALSLFILLLGFIIFSIPDVPHTEAGHILLVFLLFFFLLTQFEFLFRFYRYFLNVVIVTDKRIHRIKKTLFTIDDHQSIDLWSLQDIRKSQHGPVQNVFGFGTIVLDAYETQMRLHFVPRIAQQYKVITGLMEQARLSSSALPTERRKTN